MNRTEPLRATVNGIWSCWDGTRVDLRPGTTLVVYLDGKQVEAIFVDQEWEVALLVTSPGSRPELKTGQIELRTFDGTTEKPLLLGPGERPARK